MLDSVEDRVDRRGRLARRFRKQQTFSENDSPLAACLCGAIADRLEPASGANALSEWLLEASRSCASFAVPMLLLAGIHREILRLHPDFVRLAEYFPTVGGRKDIEAEEIGAELERLLLAHRDTMADFLQSAAVQTNESARGLCWLLPICHLPWTAIHLVDLGCSAGLNLVADQQHYRLCGDNPGSRDFNLGKGKGRPFIIPWDGAFAAPKDASIPRILSRLGCDRHPFFLRDAGDEQRLASYVWGDQVERLAMLRQGISALRQVEHSTAPVQLFAADLPKELEPFLEQCVPCDDTVPIVVYNTYLTSYLSCKGSDLDKRLEHWARRQSRPVLWLQWEPMRRDPQPPVLGWLSWTADLWSNGVRHKWHLAWVHPHGAGIQWLPGQTAWSCFWRQQ